MPSNSPDKSLSSKLLKLRRTRTKPPKDKYQLEGAKQFQIVHTPDRLVPDRPTPTEEECREEIKRWHADADKERFGFEESLVRHAGEALLGQRFSRKKANRSLKKYEFRESDEDDSNDGDKNRREIKGKGKEVDDRSNLTGPNKGVVNKGTTGTLSRCIIDTAQFYLEGEKKDKFKREQGENTADQKYRLVREMGGLDSPPIYHPPQPHRDVEDQRWMTGKYQAVKEVPWPVVRWEPPRAAFAKPVLRRGASTTDLDLMNDVSEEEIGDRGEEVDLDSLIKTELYERGVCPECRTMLSKIEAFRCSRCGSDLVSYRDPQEKTGLQRGISQPAGASSKVLPLLISRYITTPSDSAGRLRGPGLVWVSAPSSRHGTPAPIENSRYQTPPPPSKSSLRRRQDGHTDGLDDGTLPYTLQRKEGEEIDHLRVRFADLYKERDRSQKPQPATLPERPGISRSPISGFCDNETSEQRAGLVRMASTRGREADVLMDIYDSYYD